MSIETIKRDFAAFIEANLVSTKGRITATYPDVTRFQSPSVAIDVIGSRSERTVKSGTKHRTISNRLVRVIFISDDIQEIDQLTDLFESAFSEHPDAFTSCFVFEVEAISPMILAFEEKEDIFRRDFDIRVKEII